MNKFNNKFFVYSGFLGLLVGMLVAFFLGVVSLLHNLLWEQLPDLIGNPSLYPVLICLIGGIVIGCFGQRFGQYPQSMSQILGEYRETKRVEYHGRWWKNLIAGLLVLVFGASVGPEMVLLALVAGCLTFFMDRLPFVSRYRDDLMEFAMGTSLGIIFLAPLFGISRSLETENLRNLTESRLKKYVLYIFSTFTGFLGYLLIHGLFPDSQQVFSIARMGIDFSWQGILLLVPMIILGAIFGRFFLFAEEKAEAFHQMIRNPLPLAVTGGLILGGVGMLSPYLLFSGQNTLLSFSREAADMNTSLIFLIAFGKVLVTMVCLAFNWRGGTIFPMIFASVAMALGIVQVIPYSAGLLVAVFTASCCAVVLRQPFATACLFLLLFPVELFLWIWLAGYLGNLFVKWVPFFKTGRSINHAMINDYQPKTRRGRRKE